MSFIRSKIVCTIGPSSSDPDTLNDMVEAGMDVARINTSHGTRETHKQTCKHLREIGGTSILIDLPGPKIRLGDLESSFMLQEGDAVHFTTNNVKGTPQELPVNYPRLPSETQQGGHLYISDGLIDIEITHIDDDYKGFTGLVVSGGEVSSRKGVNAPGASLSIRPPTEKDRKGMALGVEVEADWFAASFIRSAQDVLDIKKEIRRLGGDQPIISKIEHGDAIKNIKEIIDTSDGIMIARGDLGIEIPPWEVPLLQKKIISACNKKGRPVIVATQMLESMIHNPRPTRAEASDVANALLDGADAVMLSGETAIGKYPLEAVRVMNNIGLVVQGQISEPQNEALETGMPLPDVIGNLASKAVDAVESSAIIVVTRSGFSALMVSKYRPKTQILAIAKDPKISRRMHMYWGVKPLDVSWTDDRDELILRGIQRSLDLGYIQRKDVISIVSGSTMIAPGRTSTMDILSVEDVLDYASKRD